MFILTLAGSQPYITLGLGYSALCHTATAGVNSNTFVKKKGIVVVSFSARKAKAPHRSQVDPQLCASVELDRSIFRQNVASTSLTNMHIKNHF